MDVSYWENDSQDAQDRNELLILCVKGMPHLYDKYRKDYMDITKKMTSWENISKMLQKMCNFKVDAEEIQSRWKSLKDHFSAEFKKVNEYVPSGSAQQEHREKWCYYDLMDFMKPQMDHHQHDSNYIIAEAVENNTSDSANKKRSNDFPYDQDIKRQKEELLGDTEIVKELEAFITSEASAEDLSIKENEKLLESSTKQLMSILQKTEEKEMTPFQCLLADKFSEIPENRQIDVFNKLMDIMDEELLSK